jgi:alanine racemase
LPGVQVQPQTQRVYPNGTVGAHTIGYLNEVTAEELAVPLATINYEIPCAITPRVPRAYRS